jgi:hypothetical protein
MLKCSSFREAQNCVMMTAQLRTLVSLSILTNLVAIIRYEQNGWAAWRACWQSS